jgi:hypothetical protein
MDKVADICRNLYVAIYNNNNNNNHCGLTEIFVAKFWLSQSKQMQIRSVSLVRWLVGWLVGWLLPLTD